MTEGFDSDGFITIPASTGIRVMDADGANVVFSEDWMETDVSICMQDGLRTVKIFKDEPCRPEAPVLEADWHDYRHASRVSFIDGGIRFERYGLYPNGCRIAVKNGIIVISPLTADRP